MRPPLGHLSTSEAKETKEDTGPLVFGVPLKYISLVTLAVQNAALSIVMHYSRVSTPPSLSYSPASAVFLNELLKLLISFAVAAQNTPLKALIRDVFSPDSWKLGIPALLYVIQNSLQFVAIANLPVATFQVTYQMKILTTAAFSVALLRRRLNAMKWAALVLLSLGVAIVQIQIQMSPTSSQPSPPVVGSAHEYRHVMSPARGFAAVAAACFTSGLAGVYFEMVLKGSRADLWVRNVQLSFFSLLPALLPVLSQSFSAPSPTDPTGFANPLRNFGGWAWATVLVQVAGGLATALVIKYSDNILKGFATSLSIVLSFLASVALFEFRITPSFCLGASTVLAATWLYNQPAGREPRVLARAVSATGAVKVKSRPPSWATSPSEPILGEFGGRTQSFDELGFVVEKEGGPGVRLGDISPPPVGPLVNVTDVSAVGAGGGMTATERYLSAPYGSPMPSRTPSPMGSPLPSRAPSRAPSPKPSGLGLGARR
ncbi:hypothetical protein PENSPDRAFT_592487 [Peniophora sp. CONT]|nr:hypothetical protein PENSPDRAFT_592487 [Peniophora sp. CONT]